MILLLPWFPWTAEPYLDSDQTLGDTLLNEVTALIPARNEATQIRRNLPALMSQGRGLNVIIVDDQSTDSTAKVATNLVNRKLIVVPGEPLLDGWSGKLWALEQGRQHIKTRYTLLIDADIELLPGIVATALNRMKHHGYHLLSLMASPHMTSFWEKLLMPAFVYFFKLLYPFRLSNSRFPGVAAAAGGFILIETKLLNDMGGFGAIREALIDDCSLARRVKAMKCKTWIGLTHSVHSLRPYNSVAEIWNMVTRTAFTQLHYSLVVLLGCTALMLIVFAVPLIGLFWHPWSLASTLAAGALICMMISYLPTLRFYRRAPSWALAFSVIGMLFLAMTWTSALRYWQGETAQWRGRGYFRDSHCG